MRMVTLLLLSILSAYSLNLSAAPEMIRLEEALEETALNIRLDDTLNGRIEGKMCEDCPSIRVDITPETVAMHKKNIVPLIEAKKRSGKPALVIFDPKTMKVKSISW